MMKVEKNQYFTKNNKYPFKLTMLATTMSCARPRLWSYKYGFWLTQPQTVLKLTHSLCYVNSHTFHWTKKLLPCDELRYGPSTRVSPFAISVTGNFSLSLSPFASALSLLSFVLYGVSSIPILCLCYSEHANRVQCFFSWISLYFDLLPRKLNRM